VFTGFDIKLDGNSLNLRINPIIDPKLPNTPSATVPPVTIPTPQVPASPS
jgi:hypothetical protein